MSGCGRHFFGSDRDCPDCEALRLGRLQGREQARALADEQNRIRAEYERGIAREDRRAARRERRARGSSEVPLVSGAGPGWGVGVLVFFALGFAAVNAAVAALLAVVAAALVASEWRKGLGTGGRSAAVIAPSAVLITLIAHPAVDLAIIVGATWVAVHLSTRADGDSGDEHRQRSV